MFPSLKTSFPDAKCLIVTIIECSKTLNILTINEKATMINRQLHMILKNERLMFDIEY